MVAPDRQTRSPNRGGGKSNPERAKTKRLEAQVKRQRGRVEGRGGPKKDKKDSPSILDRVFGALSVGGAATAGFTNTALKSKMAGGRANPNARDFITGLGGGVASVAASGKGRIEEADTWSDVLNTAGVKNKFVRGGVGFAGDVLLDPLTYLSGGLKMAPKAAEVATVGGRAFSAAKSSTAGKAAGQTARKNFLTENAKDLFLGNKAAQAAAKKSMRGKGSDKAYNKGVQEYAFQELTKAEQAFKAANRGSIGIKFGNTTLAKSELLYRGGAKFGEKIATIPGVGEVNKMFRTAAAFPGKVNIIRRMAESSGVAVHEEAAKMFDEAFADLTKADRIQLQYAIDEGTDLTGVLGTKGADMGTAAEKLAAYYSDRGIQIKHELGLLPDSELLDNYVYHYYKNFNNPEAKKFKRARKGTPVGSENPDFIKQRKIPTLAEAKAKGLDPIEDAVDALKLYDAKVNRTQARFQFVKAIENEFGVPVAIGKSKAKALGLVKSKSKYVGDDVYFPEEIAKSMDFYDQLQDNPFAARKILRLFDRALGEVKFLQTVANPGHHVRNLAGDIFLNYEDGVVNPLRYRQAQQVIMGRDTLGKSLRIGNNRLSYNRVWNDFLKAGGKSGFYPNELGQKGVGKVKSAIRNFSEQREDFTRFAHFIDAYKKEGANAKSVLELNEAAKLAGARVRKYNIDYGDFTEFEKNFMKRVVPYYSWLRKNVPNQLEMLALHPNRLAAVPKAQRALEVMLGTDKQETGQIVPKWIKEMSAVNLRGEGEGRNSIYWTPPNPMTDPANLTEGGSQGIISNLLAQTNPAIRMPFEYATGKTLFSGAPVKDSSKFTTDIIPHVRTTRKLKEDLSGESGKDPKITFLNWLSGAGLQEVGEKQKQSELRRQQDSLQAYIRADNERRKSGKQRKSR